MRVNDAPEGMQIRPLSHIPVLYGTRTSCPSQVHRVRQEAGSDALQVWHDGRSRDYSAASQSLGFRKTS